MPSRPALSVIVPCFNVQKYVPETITSLVNNAADDYEFIFVDDYSTDETHEILRLLPAQHLKNGIVIRHEVNKGIAAARNTGIEAASGRYLTFLDGDDWMAPDHLPSLVAAIERHDVDFVRTDHVRSTGKARQIHRAPEGRRDVPLDPRDSILPATRTTMVDYPYSWAGLYHRRLVDRGLMHFHEELRTAEDRPWIWRLHRKADSYAVVNLHGLFYRRGVSNSLTQIGDIRQLDFFRAFDLVLQELSEDPKAEMLRRKAIRTYCAVIAYHVRLKERLERDLADQLRQRAAAALRAFSRDELNDALSGMGDERQRILRRLRGGLKGLVP